MSNVAIFRHNRHLGTTDIFFRYLEMSDEPSFTVLMPFYIIIYTDDLLYASDFSINLFADDICPSLCHNNINILNRYRNVQASNFLLSEYYHGYYRVTSY